eukprot:PhM_4_TR17416/c2_g1_i1/m.82265
MDFRPDQASPLLVSETAGQFVDRLKRCLKSTFTGHSYARRGLHPDTRQQHLRALHELCSLPAELREQSIPFAVLALLERGRMQRKLSWTTVLQQSGAFAGALRRLPQYTMPALQPVMLSHDSMWRDATSHILSNTKAVLPKSHGEISHDTMVKIIEKQSASLHLQMFLILMWAATSRPGDIAQLRTGDVRLLEDEADGKTVVSVHFVRGKTLKKQDPYTVFTKIPTPWARRLATYLSQREGTEDLFQGEHREGAEPAREPGQSSGATGRPEHGSEELAARERATSGVEGGASRHNHAIHEARVEGHSPEVLGFWANPQFRQQANAPRGLSALVSKMLRSNRYAQLPKSETLGIAYDHLPLHIKPVTPINLAILDTLHVVDGALLARWRAVQQWLSGEHPPVRHHNTVHEARITDAELARLIEVAQVEPTSAEMVKATCNVFPIPEFSKNRRRLIKHTKDLNDTFGKDTLVGVKLPRTKDLPATVFDGSYCITLDFAAWFDQIPLADVERSNHCFLHNNKWYRLTRLPMGQRQAVDVASTITDMLVSYPMPKGIRVDTYIDNIRFLGDVREAVVGAAADFVRRSSLIGAQLNEIVVERGKWDDLEQRLDALVVHSGDFLGIEYDYILNRVRVAAKAIKKLRTLYDMMRAGPSFTYQNFLALFGILFFAMQVTRPPVARHYYALREYSAVARRVQHDPGIMATQYQTCPSKLRLIARWVEDTLDNAWVNVVPQGSPRDTDFLLVTDASSWGWGAILWNYKTGDMLDAAGRWESMYEGKKTSTWAESEGIARALRHFFPDGPPSSLVVLTDSEVAAGAFTKGRSAAYAVNKAVQVVQDAGYYSAPLSFHHIKGELNPADGLSRGKVLGEEEKELATARVYSVLMGIPPRGG